MGARAAASLLALALALQLLLPAAQPLQALAATELRLDVLTRAMLEWQGDSLRVRAAGWATSVSVTDGPYTSVTLGAASNGRWAMSVANYGGLVAWEECEALAQGWEVYSAGAACWLVGPEYSDTVIDEIELALYYRGVDAQGLSLLEARGYVNGVEVGVIRFALDGSHLALRKLRASGAVEGVPPAGFAARELGAYTPFTIVFPFPKLPGRQLEFRASVEGPSPEARVLSVEAEDRGWYYLVRVSVDAPPVTETRVYRVTYQEYIYVEDGRTFTGCAPPDMPPPGWTPTGRTCGAHPVTETVTRNRYLLAVEAVDASTGALVARLELPGLDLSAGGGAEGSGLVWLGAGALAAAALVYLLATSRRRG